LVEQEADMTTELMIERANDAMVFIRLYIKTHGYGPTYAEIARALNLGTTHSVTHSVKLIINYLIEMNLIRVYRTEAGTIMSHTMRIVEEQHQ
jgi:SOS-response transcriptional repressor LexA